VTASNRAGGGLIIELRLPLMVTATTLEQLPEPVPVTREA
jgi:hypothetical protein